MLTARSRPAVAFVVASLLAGCLPDYFPRRPLRGISEADVAGRWQLTQSAPPAASADNASVEFFADGRCRLYNFAHGDDEDSGDYTWRLDVAEGSKATVLYITGFGTPERPLASLFYFTRKRGKLVLWQYVGDPDSRDYIEYERI